MPEAYIEASYALDARPCASRARSLLVAYSDIHQQTLKSQYAEKTDISDVGRDNVDCKVVS